MHTYAETLERLERIVATKPVDYRYITDPKAVETSRNNQDYIRTNEKGQEVADGCYYRHTDKTPACLVGQVLYDIDPDFEPLEEGFSERLLPPHIRFDAEALELLKVVQMDQDLGCTWREALDAAKRNHG